MRCKQNLWSVFSGLLLVVPVVVLLLALPVGAEETHTVYQQGVMAFDAGRYEEAAEHFRHLTAEQAENHTARYYLAASLEKTGHAQEAMAQYRYITRVSRDTKLVAQAKENYLALIQHRQPRIEVHPSENMAAVAVVPLKQHRNALMVDATLNNQLKGTFILDTGATYTSISRDMAYELGLDLVNTPKVVVTTANGRIEVPKVVIAKMNVNGLEARNVEATVMDLRKGASFSGLLGLSFIRKFRLTIDTAHNQLLFEPNP